jgi:hypothetical protein
MGRYERRELDEIRPFSWRAPPLPGESFAGYAVRIFDGNGYDSCAEALRLCGVENFSPALAAMYGTVNAIRFAAAFGIEEDVVRPMLTGTVGDPGRTLRVHFFDGAVRALYLETSVRRVSPMSLRIAPHHRALWLLRPLPICVETFEPLIGACPHCDATLGWRHAKGVAFCEACGGDLRDGGEGPVDCDQEAIRFAAGLLDPCREPEGLATLHDDLRGLGPSDLFEFLIALVCAQLPFQDGQIAPFRRISTVADFSESTVARLTKAARALMDWPRAMHDFADELRDTASRRPGHYGVKKELGPLVIMQSTDPHLSPEVKRVLSEFIAADMRRSEYALAVRRSQNRENDDLVTLEQAQIEFSIDARTLKEVERRGGLTILKNPDVANSPQLLSRREITELFRRKERAISHSTVVSTTGLQHKDATAIIRAGLIRPIDEAVRATIGMGSWYEADDLDALIGGMVRRVSPDRPDRAVRLTFAAARLHGDENAWAPILRAILAGHLKLYRDTDQGRSLFASFWLDSIEETARVIGVENHDVSDRMSTVQAAKELQTSVPVIGVLRERKLIGTALDHRGVSRRMLEQFKNRYVLTHEIVLRTRFTHVTVTAALKAAGIAPAFAIMKNNRGTDQLAWDRLEVERFISENPPRSRM